MTVAAPARAIRVSAPRGLLGDERLARLVGAGDERAFATLFARYHQALYRYCRSLVVDEDDAQDALQSTMTGALVALRRGQRDAPLRPWLYRIAHNESISLLRRRRPTDELGETMAGPSSLSPESRFAERERLGMLVADLQELPERQRGALVMRELSGLSHEDIAAALGISISSAKQSIFEARRGLLEFAEGRAMACEEVLRMISDGDRRALRGRRVRAHLRDCRACAAFAAAIPARKADLMAIAPPLAPLAAAGMISRLLGSGSGHGGGGATVAAAAAGKSAGAALVAKTVAGVAVLATATAGVTGALAPAKHHRADARGASAAAKAAAPGPPAAAARAERAARRRSAAGEQPLELLAPATTPSGSQAAGISAGRSAASAAAGLGARLKPGSQPHGPSSLGRVVAGALATTPPPRPSAATVRRRGASALTPSRPFGASPTRVSPSVRPGSGLPPGRAPGAQGTTRSPASGVPAPDGRSAR